MKRFRLSAQYLRCPAAAKRPHDPHYAIQYLEGDRRSVGTYLYLITDPIFPAPFYVEAELPDRRVANRVDVLGLVRTPKAKVPSVLVRTYDRFGFIRRAEWPIRSVLRVLRSRAVRLWRGTPGELMRWVRVRPQDAKLFEALLRAGDDLPKWDRRASTRCWAIVNRPRRRVAASSDATPLAKTGPGTSQFVTSRAPAQRAVLKDPSPGTHPRGALPVANHAQITATKGT
jgi:hypothetical protein